MPQQKYSYYKNKINSGEEPAKVIEEARLDYTLVTDYNFDPSKFNIGIYIPFNLEREYVISLIEAKKYTEARKHLENMKMTYTGAVELNFIETYEYHLHATEFSEKNIRSAIEEAKKEFNQHTITIVTVVVGVITLLGTANQAFTVSNFDQGVKTFWSITLAIMLIIILSFGLNKSSKK